MRLKGGTNTTARVWLYFRLFCKILLERIYLSKIALSFFRGERKFPATPCRNFFLAMRLEGCKDFYNFGRVYRPQTPHIPINSLRYPVFDGLNHRVCHPKNPFGLPHIAKWGSSTTHLCFHSGNRSTPLPVDFLPSF